MTDALLVRAVEAGEKIAAEKDRLIALQEVRIAQLKAEHSGSLWIAFGMGGIVGLLLGWWLL